MKCRMQSNLKEVHVAASIISVNYEHMDGSDGTRIHRYYIAYGLGLDTQSFPCALRVVLEVVKLYCSIQ